MQKTKSIYHHTRQMLVDEQELIKKAKENPKNFAPLYKKYFAQIFRYVNIKIMDEHTAHDVTSQVFFKALKNIHRFEYRGVPMASWLYRIAKSEVNQSFRDTKARRTINIDQTQVATVMKVFEEETSEINKKRLYRALAQLKSTDLELMRLRYFEQRPYKEIGTLLHLTENNAKVKTFRALKKLKEIFEKQTVSTTKLTI